MQLLPEDGVPKEIQSTARHSTDIESAIREHEGYTPSDDLEGAEESATFTDKLKGAPYFLSVHSGLKADPCIIPFNTHGVVDVEGVGISESELMGHAFINSIADKSNTQPDITERYAYQRGGRFVNEYARLLADGTPHEGDPDNPNHLLGCFPSLFPYGRGGFETNRSTKVTYERHIKWALCYHDRR